MEARLQNGSSWSPSWSPLILAAAVEPIVPRHRLWPGATTWDALAVQKVLLEDKLEVLFEKFPHLLAVTKKALQAEGSWRRVVEDLNLVDKKPGPKEIADFLKRRNFKDYLELMIPVMVATITEDGRFYEYYAKRVEETLNLRRTMLELAEETLRYGRPKDEKKGKILIRAILAADLGREPTEKEVEAVAKLIKKGERYPRLDEIQEKLKKVVESFIKKGLEAERKASLRRTPQLSQASTYARRSRFAPELKP